MTDYNFLFLFFVSGIPIRYGGVVEKKIYIYCIIINDTINISKNDLFIKEFIEKKTRIYNQ